MKNNLFLKSTIILLITTGFTRLLGFFVRIISVRVLREDGINLYSLVMPTYSLFLALTELGLPLAISTIIARSKRLARELFISISPFIIVLNIFIVFLINISAPFIGNILLKNSDTIILIRAFSLVLPFVSISSLLKGYFFGKQNMFPYLISNILEQVLRIILLIFILPKYINKGYVYLTFMFISLGAISELFSIIIFLLFLPKKIKLGKIKLKPNYNVSLELLSLCIPNTSSRLFGNIAYFLEPILLTYVLSYVNYSKSYIISSYGIYSAYVIPLLMIPSFLVQSFTTSLVPEISKLYTLKDYKSIKSKLFKCIIIIIIFGFIINTFVFINAKYLLKLIFNTTKGAEYIKVLSFVFVLHNLEGPLSSCLTALNRPKDAFICSSIGIIAKLLAIVIIGLLKVGIYNLIIGEILDITITIYLYYKSLRKILS